MRFGEIIREARKPSLVVSPRHDAWLVLNGNPVYSKEALEFGAHELLKQATPRKRGGSVSASSLGSCMRKQQFTFLGLTEGPLSSKTAQIFQNGTFMHIRWQMAGLTEGWLREAEVRVPKNTLRLTGTQDGIAYDGTVVEFKSINPHGFSSVNTFGPKNEHRFQVGTYMLATGATKASIIYENKADQEYREFIVELDDDLVGDVRDTAQILWQKIDDHQLFEPKSKCIDQTGWEYNYCPFKDQCLGIKTWEEAERVAS